MKHVKYFIVVAASMTVVACTPSADDVTASNDRPAPAPATVQVPAADNESVSASPVVQTLNLPDTIVAERGGFVPEGVEYDQANGRFLTGSLSEGSIFELGLDGSVTAIITDPALVSTIGIEVDEARDRILAANANSLVFQGESTGQAGLAVFSLTTGERLAMIDLGGLLDVADDALLFANDVAIADDGTAYVTDTMQNVIYRVDTNYQASLFYTFPDLEEPALNGIEYHPDGYLIIADTTSGAIYKMPIDDPDATSTVEIAEALAGADGIVWRADGALVVVQNSATDGKTTLLVSNDGWASATVVGVALHTGQATTGAAVGGEIYSIQPHFTDQAPPTLHRAVFK